MNVSANCLRILLYIVLPIINPGTGDKPDIQPEDYLPCEMAGF